jgi:hypothetical protein
MSISISDFPVDHEWAFVQVLGLEQRVTALPEAQMQQAVLSEFVETLSASELVIIIYLLQERSNNGIAAAQLVLQEMALDPGVLIFLPYPVLKAAYQLAQDFNLPQVAALFLSEPLKNSLDIDEAFIGNEHYDLPLGIRRAAARSSERLVLDRLLHDRNHHVIRLLLDNPNIIERDVITIVARRPTRPEVLEVVAKHRKWSARYRIRKALVCNPYTPNTTARQLIGTLMSHDLRELVNAGSISASIRETAQDHLNVRPAAASKSRSHFLDTTLSDNELESALDELKRSFEDDGSGAA